MKKVFLFLYLSVLSLAVFAAEPFVVFTPTGNHFPLVSNGTPCPVYIDPSEDKGVQIAIANLQQDIQRVCETKPELLSAANAKCCIIAGTYGTPFIKNLIASGKLNKRSWKLKTKNTSCKSSPTHAKE